MPGLGLLTNLIVDGRGKWHERTRFSSHQSSNHVSDWNPRQGARQGAGYVREGRPNGVRVAYATSSDRERVRESRAVLWSIAGRSRQLRRCFQSGDVSCGVLFPEK